MAADAYCGSGAAAIAFAPSSYAFSRSSPGGSSTRRFLARWCLVRDNGRVDGMDESTPSPRRTDVDMSLTYASCCDAGLEILQAMLVTASANTVVDELLLPREPKMRTPLIQVDNFHRNEDPKSFNQVESRGQDLRVSFSFLCVVLPP